MPLTRTASLGGKVTSAVVGIKSISGTASGPGEIAGPALEVTIRIDNGSAALLNLNGVAVNLANAKGDPASPLSSPPAAPFAGTLRPGASSAGTYVFSVGSALRNPVSISISYSTDTPVVVFVGKAS